MAVNLSPVGGVAAQFFTNTGAVLTGGKLFTYLAGTTTPATTFTSSNGGTAWANPIVLDAAGRVSGSGEIWLTDGITYKFVLKDTNDVLIATYDNITGINSNALAFTNQQQIITATAGQTVFNLSISYQPGTNSLSVFVDGVNQYGPGAQYAYTETDADTVTFTSGLHVGAEVKFTTTQQQSAGAVDAAQVSYNPAGTGAVATNVQAKLRQVVSVMDFGAVGDGVTNDAAAINAAIAAGSAIYFPKPSASYYIASSIIVPANKTLYGYDGTTILAANGITAIWVQGNTVTIDGLTVRFNNTLGNFSNTGSIGILVRNTASFGSPTSNWVYVNAVKIANCRIYQAYLSIQMEATFYCSVDKVDTYNDFYGITVNKDQRAVQGSVNVALPMTTLSMHRAYFHGTQTDYAIPTSSCAIQLCAVQSLMIQESVTEFCDLAFDLNAISGGTLINHYLENTNVGFQIYGALTPFIVINPWIMKGLAALPYCFRSGAGNITFIGGKVTMSGGADTFYSPNPDGTGTATFVTLPSLSGASLYTTAKLVGGINKDYALNLPTSTSTPTVNPTTVASYVAAGAPLTSGVPYPITSAAVVSGAMVLVTGYSTTGSGQWVVIYGANNLAVVVGANNSTGGTVTFSVVAGLLNVTSTGTASQVLAYVWATAIST